MTKEVVIGIFSPKGALKNCCRDGLSLFFKHLNNKHIYELNCFILKFDSTDNKKSINLIKNKIEQIYNGSNYVNEIMFRIYLLENYKYSNEFVDKLENLQIKIESDTIKNNGVENLNDKFTISLYNSDTCPFGGEISFELTAVNIEYFVENNLKDSTELIKFIVDYHPIIHEELTDLKSFVKLCVSNNIDIVLSEDVISIAKVAVEGNPRM